MKKILFVIAHFMFLINIYGQSANHKKEYDDKEEIVYDGKRYRVWNNYLTGGTLPGASISSNIPTSQTCVGLDLNFHIKREYFQGGVLLSGNVFGDWNNTSMHLCWGKKIEKNKYLFAAYGGVDYSLFYPWEKDSIPARFVSPALSEVGAYVAVQNFWKIKYDVGLGGTLFCSYNTKQYLAGLRLEMFFSSSYRGEKGRRRSDN